MVQTDRIRRRLIALLGTAVFFTAAPVSVSFDITTGSVLITDNVALAKGGNSGPGGGGNSGHGNSHDEDDDDDDDHDRDDDDDDDDDDDFSGGGTSGGTGGTGGVVKIEVSSQGVEVTYADGSREEIENGRYERKNTAGRTVDERPATQADIDRLLALR